MGEDEDLRRAIASLRQRVKALTSVSGVLFAALRRAGLMQLSAVGAATKRPELALLPAVKVLRQVWASQYVTEDGRMRLGDGAELPPSAEQICSPYDPRPATAGSAT